jgi:hypothetical protein
MKKTFRVNPINIKETKKNGHAKVVLKVELSFWHSTFGAKSRRLEYWALGLQLSES